MGEGGDGTGARSEGDASGGGSGVGLEGGEGAEEWKRRQLEAKERMMLAMKEQQALALAAMMMDMSDDENERDDLDAQPAAPADDAVMDSTDAIVGEPEIEGAGKLFLEVDEAMPTQCVLCHEGGSCSGKGAKPLGIIAFIQPSTVLSVVARRQRQAEQDRLAAHHIQQRMGDDDPAPSRGVCRVCDPSPIASPPSAAAGGRVGSPIEGSAPTRGLERGFVCGHQMIAESSVAGWEGVVSGTSAGADRDAAATGAAVSFCGHGMHAECLHRFLDTQRGVYAEHGAVLSEREFMCPLCRSLANTLVPLSALSAPSPTPAADASQSGACISMLNAATFGPGGWGGVGAASRMEVGEGAGGRPGEGLSYGYFEKMSVKELKKFAAQVRPPVDLSGCFEKAEMVAAIAAAAGAAEHLLHVAAGSPLTSSSQAGSDVRAAPEWWAVEAKKEVGFGAETEWVKGLGQRHMAVNMAARLHDLIKAATSHQTAARADLGIKDSGADLGLSAGTAICSAASALVYSVAALEMAWRLGGTGAATSEEAAADAKAMRELQLQQDDDAGVMPDDDEDDEELDEDDDVMASAAGAAVGGVGLGCRGAAGEGSAGVSSHELQPLMVFARAVRGLMCYPGNEAWRWRAVKLWTRLLRGEMPEADVKKSGDGEAKKKPKVRDLAVDSLIQADHASLLAHWLLLATPLPNKYGQHSAASASNAFSGSIPSTEREALGREFVDALRLLWLAHVAQLLLRASHTVNMCVCVCACSCVCVCV
jgi:hypothetical protein